MPEKPYRQGPALTDCKCKDWEENMKKIDAAFYIQTIHNLGGYEGKRMVYCPWCGEKLTETDKQEVNDENI